MIGVFVTALAMLTLPVAGAESEAGPASRMPSVMSDQLAFCHELGARVEASRRLEPVAPPEVDTLAQEGLTLCDQGHVRMGIQRLRTAWRVLRSRR